ncbi:phosphohydrolase [Bifidobacterium aemilianum]|uniref:Phosphohydrolase n=1 Tax=Bifidobacterium aemilianum TaxID=2493120 RepID=A0A366K9E8_9BIFI|nr:HD domain-containing protein [Bifidobacterium aemilianum]RBP98365.1 phosphohydrolase [Bifidobacterium aemilianum]
MLSRDDIRGLVQQYGSDIIESPGMYIERGHLQHGRVSTFAHSLRVACLAVWLADRLHLMGRVDLPSLIRAGLLHDYFLYDWHDRDDGSHRLHGLTHGRRAMLQAERDFGLNPIERDSIHHHMFPLTPVPPKYMEGYLVNMADKISATAETLSPQRFGWGGAGVAEGNPGRRRHLS